MNYLDKQLLNELAEYLVDSIHRPRISFPVSIGDTLTVNLTELSETGRALTLKALNAWSEVSGLIFESVEHDDAHIHFSESDNLDPGTAGTTNSSFRGNTLIRAEITISGNQIEANDISVDEAIFRTLLHEIGHALGLGHPAQYITPLRYGIDNNFTNDSYQTTVMSYFSQYDNTDLDADYAINVTPMSADILAIHELYGAPTIREGDTVYGGINSNVGGHLGSVLTELTAGNLDNPVTLTIIDHGGYDIIDFSSHDENNPGYIRTMINETTYREEPGIIGQRVNLNPGWASDVYNVKGALVIAHETVIEGFYAGAGDDHITGNNADNWLDGGPGDDTLLGGPGDDYLEGRSGTDTLDGGPGNDIAAYVNSDTGVEVHVSGTIAAGGHAIGDTLLNIENLMGSFFDDVLTGDSADNVLFGEAGNDQLNGGPGNDILEGGSGADILNGGPGQDVASYLFSEKGVNINLSSTTIAGGHAEGDTLLHIENLGGSNFSDTLTGDSADNILFGEAGNDFLRGNAGNDILGGDAGNDRLEGGTGNDTAYYASSDSGVTVRLHSLAAHGGHATGDTFANLIPVSWIDDTGIRRTEQLPDIENLTGSAHDDVLAGDRRDNILIGNAGDDSLYGGPGGGDDQLYGGTGEDELYGGLGNDKLFGEEQGDDLYGGEGNDELYGGEGEDFLNGGPGGDRLEGGPGYDTADYSSSDTGVTVRLHNQAAQGGYAEGDTFANLIPVTWTDDTGATRTEQLPDIEALIGTNHDDTLAGDRRNNHLFGLEGNDILYGGPGGGNDTMEAGSGDDQLYGGQGDDYLLSGEGNDQIYGGPDEDTLIGGTGNDQLYGGSGKDRLDGGPGDDKLDGGLGEDIFEFWPENEFFPGHGNDTIVNFEQDKDKIDLISFVFDSINDIQIKTNDEGTILDLTDKNGGTILLADFHSPLDEDSFII